VGEPGAKGRRDLTYGPDVEHPAPDLLDWRGRLRRLAIALAVGGVVAAIAYVVTDALAGPDLASGATLATRRGAARFIVYFTLLGFVVGLLATLAVLTRRARRLDQAPPVARALPPRAS